METTFNILVAGVGGQGNLVCGRALAEAAIIEQKRPVLGDTFGASRRGGSVLTHLRISDTDQGPLIPSGHADVILGMEPIEALRTAIDYASTKTVMIVSKRPVFSPATLSGEYSYPNIDSIISSLQTICGRVYAIDPQPVLDRIGTYRVLNVYMLGVVTGVEATPFSRDSIESGIAKVVGLTESNKDAFNSGTNDGRAIIDT